MLFHLKVLSYLDCREADESRLREVCESFLGPPTGMVDATLSDPKNPAWDPCVLVSLLDSICSFDSQMFLLEYTL